MNGPSPSSCPCCGSAGPAFLFEKNGAVYYRCRGCTLEFQSPLPAPTELSRYYDESYTSGLYKAFSAARLMKQLTAAERLREIRRFNPRGRLLDVGSGPGVFVAEAQRAGFDARGIELSQVAVNEARLNGLPVEQETIESYDPEKKFEFLTCFDVIEHVLDPRSFLQSAGRLLVPGGRLIMTTPNTRSLTCRLMRSRWYFYIPEEHLFLFNRRSISAILEQSGFKLLYCGITIKPLTFDYSMIQFAAYNRLIHFLLRPLQMILPQKIRSIPVPLYIGEMLVAAERL